VFNSTTIGSGLGSGPSKLLAWGLGLWGAISRRRSKRQFGDQIALRIREDDEEILEFIGVFLEVA